MPRNRSSISSGVFFRLRQVTSFRVVRWVSNDFGTVISRIDIIRAVAPGQRCATVPYVRPGGDILLRLSGWPKVERVLKIVDAIEALGIDPADAAPDYWQHVHNRMSVNEVPRSLHALAPPGLAASAEDRKVTGRVAILLTALAATALLACTIAAKRAPRYVWNASASVPIGLYRLRPTGQLFATELVAVEPPEPLATFLESRRYLPARVPLLKQVLALPGQTVCREAAHHHNRQERGRRSARTRQPGPTAARLAGLSPHCRRRSLPHELALGGLARRTIFRGAAGERDHRKGRTSLDQGRPMSLRTVRSLMAMLCFVTVVARSMLSSHAAYAGQASLPPHRASSEPLHPFAAFVTEASRRFGVPEHWIRAVMHVESAQRRDARSQRGAIGLMQIMPTTWVDLRARYGLGADPYDPRDNILAGAAYMRELHDRYGTPGFLAAYNAGPGRYERHLATGRPLPDETRAYVAALAPMISSAPSQSAAWCCRKIVCLGELFAVRNA